MAGSFVDGVLSTVTRLQAAQTLVGVGADETAAVQCALPVCRVFYQSHLPRCPRCGYPNPEPTMSPPKTKIPQSGSSEPETLTAESAKRVTTKPRTNSRSMHWECTICQHEWEAGPAQVKCPACNAGRGDLRASIEGEPHSAKAKANGKIRSWPSGLDSWGTPTWCCPQCEHPHRQSVCPAECKNCGEEGDPHQSFKGKLPATAFDRGPVPPVHPASTSTTTPAGIAANDPQATPIAQPVTAAGTVDVELAKIDGSPDNPRKSFPDAELQELATSIEAKGLQQALEILPADAKGRHELLDGERRLRALQSLAKKDKARWRTVPCIVKPLTRDQARDYRLATFVREGLNPIDQARAFEERLAAGGITQEQLGKLVGLTQGAVANKLRLLKAPAGLQHKVISQEMTEKQLRELVGKFGDVPQVLTEFAKSSKKESLIGQDVDDLYELDDILAEMTRPMVKTGWNATPFKWTAEQEKQLDVRTVGKEKVACNVKLWDELADKSVKARTVAGDKAEAKQKEKKLTPAEMKERKKKQDAIFAKRLYRYKIAWLQRRCVERLNDKAPVDPAILLRLALHFAVEGQSSMNRQEDLGKVIVTEGGKKKASTDFYYSRFADYESLLTVDEKRMFNLCQAAVAKFINHPFEGYHAGFEPREIEALAGELRVDIAREWQCDREFLELHTSAQLNDLREEWGIVLLTHSKRSEIISATERDGQKQKFKCPKELLTLKGVRL